MFKRIALLSISAVALGACNPMAQSPAVKVAAAPPPSAVSAPAVPPPALASAKQKVGKTYISHYAITNFCKYPDTPDHPDAGCVTVTAHARATVTNAVLSNGQVFYKIKLDDGRTGFLMEGDLGLLEDLSKTPPQF